MPARPVAAAGTNETPRSNLLAYNITTGNLITSFAPVVNGQILSVAASPDGTRLYIAGEFTSVNGLTRNRVAAFNTGDRSADHPPSTRTRQRVKSVAATNSTVYVGGMFTAATASRVPGWPPTRPPTAALTAGHPAPTTRSTPWPFAGQVQGSSSAGAFPNINGTAAYGLGAVDAATGGDLPWAANHTVRNAGTSASISR